MSPPEDEKFQESERDSIIEELRLQEEETAQSAGHSSGHGGHPTGHVTVVDSFGHVIGHGHVTSSGTLVTDIVDTTVVDEGSSSSSSHAPGWQQPDEPPVDTSPPGEEVGSHGGSAPPAQPNMGTFHVLPGLERNRFVFVKGPGNDQETGCVSIGFGLRGAPGARFLLGVQVTAPYEMRDGRILSAEEAQQDAWWAATEIAVEMTHALNEGVLNPTQVMARFHVRMGEHMASWGYGYRVNQCFPSG